MAKTKIVLADKVTAPARTVRVRTKAKDITTITQTYVVNKNTR